MKKGTLFGHADLVRKLWFEEQKAMAKVRLTPYQLKTVKYVKSRGEPGATSSAHSLKYGLYIQQSSDTLRRLYEKGYLVRRKVDALTGGKEYIYHSTV